MTDEDLTQACITDDIMILKLHGDLGVRDTVVLTEEDYRQFEAKRPGVSVKVRQLLIEHPLMFIGFSLTDPNFARIDGWIRDTVGKVRLPAIAIMHGEPLSAERSMWRERGVELVQLRNGESMERLVNALGAEGKREDSGAAESNRVLELEQELNGIVQRERDADTANRELARVLGEIVTGAAGDGDEDDAARQIAHAFSFGWPNIFAASVIARATENVPPASPGPAPSPWGVYQQLSKSARRQLLLLALAAGRAQLILGEHRVDVVNEVRDPANAHGFSKDEQALAFMYRARIHADAGELGQAQTLICEARGCAASSSVHSRITLENRDLLFQAGDEQLLGSELQRPLDQQADVHAMCRRGADFLLLGRRDDADRWYLGALNRATSGDERYVALWGRRAALHQPGDFSRASYQRDEQLRRTIVAIPDAERPKTLRAEEGGERAARAALDGKSREEIAEPLRRYLWAARRLGMPHSSDHDVSFPLEGNARRIAAVLLDVRRFDDGEGQQAFAALKEALATLIRYGLANDVTRLFTPGHCNVVLHHNGTSWFRELVASRATLPRQADALLATALSGLPLLDDAQISSIVDRVLELTTRSTELIPKVPLHPFWKQLRGFAEHLPEAPAARVFDFLLSSFQAPVRLRLLEPDQFPLQLWRRLGHLGDRSDVSRKIFAAMTEALRGGVWQSWFDSVLAFLNSAIVSELIEPGSSADLVQVLDDLLNAELDKKNDGFGVMCIAVPLVALKPDADALKKLARAIEPLVQRHLWSSSAGRTLHCARQLVPMLEPAQVTALTDLLLKRSENILSEGEEWFDSTAHIAATLAALAQRETARREEIVAVLARLIERFPAALFASIVEADLPIDAATWASSAERALLPVIGHSRAERLIALPSWLKFRYGLDDCENVLEGLIGLLLADEWRTRKTAVHALRGFYVAHPGSAPEARDRIVKRLITMSEHDPDWRVRSAVLEALAPVGRRPDDQAAILALLDRIALTTAIERRCAELLRREWDPSQLQESGNSS